jgi:hypothetical protein
MEQIIRELKRQLAGEKLTPEQLKGLIRADYIYRSGDLKSDEFSSVFLRPLSFGDGRRPIAL